MDNEVVVVAVGVVMVTPVLFGGVGSLESKVDGSTTEVTHN